MRRQWRHRSVHIFLGCKRRREAPQQDKQSHDAHADMGLRLRQAFVTAGLPPAWPGLQARVEGGPDSTIYRYITDNLRSMLPLVERFGIATLSKDDVDELERRPKEEVTARGGVLASPVVVGAWCQLPP